MSKSAEILPAGFKAPFAKGELRKLAKFCRWRAKRLDRAARTPAATNPDRVLAYAEALDRTAEALDSLRASLPNPSGDLAKKRAEILLREGPIEIYNESCPA